MKLILAIVSNDDSGAVSSALTRGGFSVTKLATTGGFLIFYAQSHFFLWPETNYLYGRRKGR